MTKSELVAAVANRLPYLTRKDAEIIVDTIFDSMIEALVSGAVSRYVVSVALQ